MKSANKANVKNVKKEPLLHIAKAPSEPVLKVIIVKVVTIMISLFIAAIICGVVSGNNPFELFPNLLKGAFGSERRRNVFFRDASLLLLVALALLPAFKMKFWNLGGNGQIMMGCIATMACMKFLGGVWPSWLVVIMMFLCGILAGAIWAVIPAVFKAIFKTNESLFTLMMNYIATGLAGYFITKYSDSGSGTINPVYDPAFPEIGGGNYLLPIIIAVCVFAFMLIYFKFTKHGYELSVVGESENTARYVGINVKKVIIRTMILSGAICGLVGALLVGGINHTFNAASANNMGFTAIMVAWLGRLNPIMVAVSALFIMFIDKGMATVNTAFGITSNAASQIVLGIIYFFIIACEFVIIYQIKVRGKKNNPFGGFIKKGGMQK